MRKTRFAAALNSGKKARRGVLRVSAKLRKKFSALKSDTRIREPDAARAAFGEQFEKIRWGIKRPEVQDDQERGKGTGSLPSI